ncbi:MAG: DUF123 domain-containing protein [Candidatus Hermodarchaeota archaeon]
MKGSYILVIYLPEDFTIRIGGLGDVEFINGYYLYIGSAMGNKGSASLENRIKRHISTSNQKRIFWHIDYLLADKTCVITRIYLIPSLTRLECTISKEISKCSDNSIRNFGSSDCDCHSHLYFYQKFDDLKQIGKTT